MLRKMEFLLHGPAALGFVLVLALAVQGLGTGPPAAQGSTASVEVVATGTDGAPLPGVTVTLQNRDTGLTRTDVTGAQGIATLEALPPGNYKADLSLQGQNISYVPADQGETYDWNSEKMSTSTSTNSNSSGTTTTVEKTTEQAR